MELCLATGLADNVSWEIRDVLISAQRNGGIAARPFSKDVVLSPVPQEFMVYSTPFVELRDVEWHSGPLHMSALSLNGLLEVLEIPGVGGC